MIFWSLLVCLTLAIPDNVCGAIFAWHAHMMLFIFGCCWWWYGPKKNKEACDDTKCTPFVTAYMIGHWETQLCLGVCVSLCFYRAKTSFWETFVCVLCTLCIHGPKHTNCPIETSTGIYAVQTDNRDMPNVFCYFSRIAYPLGQKRMVTWPWVVVVWLLFP